MPHFTKNNFKYLNVYILTVIVLGGVALYFQPLQSTSFNFDDHASIENNSAIKTFDIPRIFEAFNTRFLVGLSFAINYKWSGLHPAGYRLINLLIHCLNAFLVYWLAKFILYRHPERSLKWPACFASLLFLCHPIQTEPVNFITQRFVLMATFFYLLTLIMYIQYRCGSQKRYLVISIGSAIAAMLCKEFVVTLPLMITLFEFYFLGSLNETIIKRCRCLAPYFIIVLIVPVLLLRTPPQAIGVARIAGADSNHHIDITRARNALSRKQYFLTEINVVPTYIRLLFVPINQNFDYDYPVTSQMDLKTVMSGVFLLCLLVMAIVTYKAYRIISFSILWFFIALSVESGFIPIGHVIAEYRVYLASIGFVFFVMTLIYARQINVRKLNIMAAVILMGFSVLTYQRNRVWRDEMTLWNDTVRKSPHKAIPYNNRGYVFYQEGSVSQAIADYKSAIGIDPNYADAYNNLGWAFYNQGKLSQAFFEYNQAIENDPYLSKAYYNRALVYDKQGKRPQAISDFNKAIAIDPDYADTYLNRAHMYYTQGNFAQALLDCDKAIEINPGYAEAYYNRGNTYMKLSNPDRAMSDYNKAIAINPHYTDAYNNRGLVWDAQDNFTQAIEDYSKAIEINHRYTDAYNNRAVAYYRLKEYKKAWEDMHKAEQLGHAVNPGFISALKQVSGQGK